jgi:hypothetical protein
VPILEASRSTAIYFQTASRLGQSRWTSFAIASSVYRSKRIAHFSLTW